MNIKPIWERSYPSHPCPPVWVMIGPLSQSIRSLPYTWSRSYGERYRPGSYQEVRDTPPTLQWPLAGKIYCYSSLTLWSVSNLLKPNPDTAIKPPGKSRPYVWYYWRLILQHVLLCPRDRLQYCNQRYRRTGAERWYCFCGRLIENTPRADPEAPW